MQPISLFNHGDSSESDKDGVYFLHAGDSREETFSDLQ